jgi:osmotically-inducible protein OsmY
LSLGSALRWWNFARGCALYVAVKAGVNFTMKHIARWVLIAMMGAAAAACSSTDEQGSTEAAAANAGRVVDDSVITGKVKAALVADPTTKAHQISVETFKGVVQLSGFVDTSEAKQRASQVAENVEGVRDVKNELELRSRNN